MESKSPRPIDPFVMVIFGVTGDLAQNKLLPSLFALFEQGFFPAQFSILGFARREFSDQDLRDHFPALAKETAWPDFASHLFYQQGTFEKEDGYLSLVTRLKDFDRLIGRCALRLFYLATPPVNYETILGFLDRTQLSLGCGQDSDQWTRVIVEKPFGTDLETARALDKTCSLIFKEEQIFRVDHYLGKETVQNMLAFRFANGIFEPAWNKDHLNHVQILWAERKGVEERGKFFDSIGLLRDIAQNHLMQLIAAVAMEPPSSFVKEAIRNARTEAIRSLRCLEPEEVTKYTVRGQYEGYLRELDIPAESGTETFVAFKCFVDSPRLAGVPFYVLAGKKMPVDLVQISLVFNQTCHLLFDEFGCPEIGNALTIRIQPNEGISMRFIAKRPGVGLALQPVNMRFSYEQEFEEKISDAYQRILLDIFKGDQTLCSRSDELDYSWEFVSRILAGWKGSAAPALHSYRRGTWGPEAAVELLKADGKSWLRD